MAATSEPPRAAQPWNEACTRPWPRPDPRTTFMSKRATRLTSEQRQWLDSVCEGRGRALPPDLPHVLAERRARAAPDAVALRHREQSLTHRELNQRANRLARYLMAKGI